MEEGKTAWTDARLTDDNFEQIGLIEVTLTRSLPQQANHELCNRAPSFSHRRLSRALMRPRYLAMNGVRPKRQVLRAGRIVNSQKSAYEPADTSIVKCAQLDFMYEGRVLNIIV